jgi:hypothetical protein
MDAGEPANRSIRSVGKGLDLEAALPHSDVETRFRPAPFNERCRSHI